LMKMLLNDINIKNHEDIYYNSFCLFRIFLYQVKYSFTCFSSVNFF
jgi:hypothetical protein